MRQMNDFLPTRPEKSNNSSDQVSLQVIQNESLTMISIFFYAWHTDKLGMLMW